MIATAHQYMMTCPDMQVTETCLEDPLSNHQPQYSPLKIHVNPNVPPKLYAKIPKIPYEYLQWSLSALESCIKDLNCHGRLMIQQELKSQGISKSLRGELEAFLIQRVSELKNRVSYLKDVIASCDAQVYISTLFNVSPQDLIEKAKELVRDAPQRNKKHELNAVLYSVGGQQLFEAAFKKPNFVYERVKSQLHPDQIQYQNMEAQSEHIYNFMKARYRDLCLQKEEETEAKAKKLSQSKDVPQSEEISESEEFPQSKKLSEAKKLALRMQEPLFIKIPKSRREEIRKQMEGQESPSQSKETPQSKESAKSKDSAAVILGFEMIQSPSDSIMDQQ